MSISKMTNPIVNRTVSSVIADHLRERILSGDLTDGEALRQDTLAAEYSVSRIPLREALRQLEAEGLITSFPHRGATVTRLSIEEINDIYEIRALIECDLLANSIPDLDEQSIDRAETLMLNYTERLDDNSTAFSWGSLNWEFHSLLYSGVNRPKSMMILQNLHLGIGSFAHNHFVVKNVLEAVVQEHFDLVAHCRDRNVEAAVNLLRRHILGWRGVVVDNIEKQRRQEAEELKPAS